MSLQLLTILSPTTPCIPTLLLTALSRDRSRNDRSPFTGRFPFLASPLRCRLANASGRIEFIIVLFMDWSFASSCSPPRLSTSQLLSATDRPVLLSDWDFHPIVGAHFQAHISRALWLVGFSGYRPRNQFTSCLHCDGGSPKANIDRPTPAIEFEDEDEFEDDFL